MRMRYRKFCRELLRIVPHPLWMPPVYKVPGPMDSPETLLLRIRILAKDYKRMERVLVGTEALLLAYHVDDEE